MSNGLIDPVDSVTEEMPMPKIAGLHSDRLLEDEVVQVPPGAARTSHPFAGYQLAPDIAIFDYHRQIKEPAMVSRTYLILLPVDSTFQDLSGDKITHQVFAKDKLGKDLRLEDPDGRLKPPKVAKTTVVTLRNFHNVTTVHPNTQEHQKWIWDRVVKVGQRWVACCYIPSHSARAQIVYRIDKSGRVMVDNRYELADKNQIGPLGVLFRRVYYQQTKAERLAQSFDKEASGVRDAMGAAGADDI